MAFLQKNKVALLVVGIVVLVPLLFFGTARQMVHVWSVNETFTHGFLIFPIAIWLIFDRRKELSGLDIQPSLWLFAPMIATLVLWLVANLIDVKVLQQLAIVSLIPTFIWLLLGKKVLLEILFPIGFLFFAIPVGQALIPPMMEFTANFTVQLVKLSGVPILQEGLSFRLPTGSWSVVEECSGVRYLIASLALGTVYAYLTFTVLRKRIVFIAAAIILPIIANGLRAFGIVMIGHLSGMKYATGVDHLLYGWVFFGVVIFLLFFIGSFWSDPRPAHTDYAIPNSDNASSKIRRKGLALLAVCVIFSTAVQALASSYRTTPDAAGPGSSIVMASTVGAWKAQPAADFGWSPERLPADFNLEVLFVNSGENVQVNIDFYSFQRDGAEAVSSQNRLTNPYGGEWKLIDSAKYTKDDLVVIESQVRFRQRTLLVWNWYSIGGRQASSPYLAKLYEVFNIVIQQRTDAALITMATEFDDLDTSRERLRDFFTESQAEIKDTLERLSDRGGS